MDLNKLKPFIKKAMESPNPQISNMAQLTTHDVDAFKEQEDFSIPELDDGHQPLEVEDLMLSKALPELELPDPNDKSTFGKVNGKNLNKIGSYYDKLVSKLAKKEKKASLFTTLTTKYGKRHHSRQAPSKK